MRRVFVQPAIQPPAENARLKFAADAGFQREVRRRVEDFFARTGLPQRDCPAMYAKTAAILAAFALCYGLLVFVAIAWWQALPLALLLGFVTATIGFNIQHDGSHRAYSDHSWVNKLMAMSLDMVGGSSYMWRWKHVIFHHTYVNIEGYDSDIDLGMFGRVSPEHRRRALHRWQHLYLWPLYGFLVVKWHFFDDFRDFGAGHMGRSRFPRPQGWERVAFFVGKLGFLVLAFGLPLLFHPFWVVAVCYLIAAGVTGVVLSVVFQLAHCVEAASFPVVKPGSMHVENAWAIHQVETTVDFARDSRLVSWLVGGLNFQIEHHLFPTVCHIHYPAISKLVEQTCREFRVKYTANDSLYDAVASHFRWLRQMGMPESNLLAGAGASEN
jgi:linoleoyl-CoA desaturase